MSKKGEKLYDAITLIDDDLLETQARKRKMSRSFKALAAVAAAAVIAISFFGIRGMLGKKPAGGEKPSEAGISSEYSAMTQENSLVISKAEYPSAIKYGGVNGSEFSAWEEDLRTKRTQKKYYIDSLRSFSEKTLGEVLSDSGTDNAVYSPTNVYMALSMLAECSDTQSRQELLRLLGCDSIDSVRAYSNSMWNINYRDDGATKCVFANSIWLNDKIKFNKQLTDLLASNYYASSFAGDMSSDKLAGAYREWLNTQTDGLLKNYTDKIKFDSNTVMALASTVNFSAKWSNEFSKANTSQGIFRSPSGDVSCDFMHSSGQDYYYWGEHYSAVAKPFGNSYGAMWFILPDSTSSVSELLNDSEAIGFICSDEKYNYKNRQHVLVNMAVPRFDVTSQTDLIQPLKNLGVNSIFDSNTADFSGLCQDSDGVFVNKISHNVRVTVDENGCKAVAYTDIGLAGSAMPPDEKVDFVLDRPFIFVISGLDGLPMFIGVVNTPVNS